MSFKKPDVVQLHSVLYIHWYFISLKNAKTYIFAIIVFHVEGISYHYIPFGLLKREDEITQKKGKTFISLDSVSIKNITS